MNPADHLWCANCSIQSSVLFPCNRCKPHSMDEEQVPRAEDSQLGSDLKPHTCESKLPLLLLPQAETQGQTPGQGQTQRPGTCPVPAGVLALWAARAGVRGGEGSTDGGGSVSAADPTNCPHPGSRYPSRSRGHAQLPAPCTPNLL